MAAAKVFCPQVALRIRPLSDTELEEGAAVIAHKVGDQVRPEGRGAGARGMRSWGCDAHLHALRQLSCSQLFPTPGRAERNTGLSLSCLLSQRIKQGKGSLSDLEQFPEEGRGGQSWQKGKSAPKVGVGGRV